MSIESARAELEHSLRRIGESIRSTARDARALNPRMELLELVVEPHLRAMPNLVRGKESEKQAKCYFVEIATVLIGAKPPSGTYVIDIRTETDPTLEESYRKMQLLENVSIRAYPDQLDELRSLSKNDGPWIALMTNVELIAKWQDDPIGFINSICELREYAKSVSFDVAKDWKNNQLKAFFSTS